ncbi:MAG: hypothetical protein V3575_06720 [Candidatus Absconditabacteria bacterium]
MTKNNSENGSERNSKGKIAGPNKIIEEIFSVLSSNMHQYISQLDSTNLFDNILEYIKYWKSNPDQNKNIIGEINSKLNRKLVFEDIQDMEVSGKFLFENLGDLNKGKSFLDQQSISLIFNELIKKLKVQYKDLKDNNIASNKSNLGKVLYSPKFNSIEMLNEQGSIEFDNIINSLSFTIYDLVNISLPRNQVIKIMNSDDLESLEGGITDSLNMFIKLSLFDRLDSVSEVMVQTVERMKNLFKIGSYSQLINSLPQSSKEELKTRIDNCTDVVQLDAEMKKLIFDNHYLSDSTLGIIKDDFKGDIETYKLFLNGIFSEKGGNIHFGEESIEVGGVYFRYIGENGEEILDLDTFKSTDTFDFKAKLNLLNNNKSTNGLLGRWFKDDYFTIGEFSFHKSQKIFVERGGVRYEGYYHPDENSNGDFYLTKNLYLSENVLGGDVLGESKGDKFSENEIKGVDCLVTLDDNDIERLFFAKLSSDSFSALSESQKLELSKKMKKENRLLKEKKIRRMVESKNENSDNIGKKETPLDKINNDKKQLDNFASEFFSMYGDKELDFGDFEALKLLMKKTGGITLYFRLGEAVAYGDGSEWLKINIFSVDENTRKFKVKLGGVEGSIGKYDGKVMEFDINSEIISNRKNQSFGAAFKTSTLNTFKDFASYIETAEMKSDWKGISSSLNRWKSLKKDKKGFNNSKGEKIQYAGKQIKTGKDGKQDYYYAYKLTFEDDIVRVTGEGGFSKEMDYNALLMFLGEKNLYPLSKNDLEINQLSLKAASKQPEVAPWGISVMTIINTFKTIKSNFTKKLEDYEDMRKVRFYSRFMNSASAKVLQGTLGAVSFGLLSEPFADLKMEGDTWLDEKIMQVIKSNKGKLGRDGSVNANVVADKIKEDIFQTSNIHKKNPLKAAGYFLNALESGGMYYRKLSPYAGSGMWVLALFGPEHQQKFLSERASLIYKLNLEPTNSKLVEELSKIEYLYIKRIMCIPEFQKVYGTQIVGSLEGAFGSLIGQGTINKAKEDSEPKVFEDIYDDYKGALTQMRTGVALGNLKSLTKKIGVDGDYSKWYFSMLLPIVSGYSIHNFTESHRKTYGNMGYTNGFSPALYVRDAQGPYKLAKLLDYASKAAGLSGDDLFTVGSGWDKNKSSIDSGDLTNSDKKDSNYSKFAGDFEKWWTKHGDKIMPILNLEDLALENCAILKGINDENLDSTVREELKDYLNNKITKDGSDSFGFSDDDFLDEGIQYQKSLFSLSDGLAKKVMLDYDNYGRFRKPEAQYLWSRLDDRISSINKLHNQPKQTTEFVFTKFATWFKSNLDTNLSEVICKLDSLNKDSDQLARNELKNAILKSFKVNKSYMSSNNLPIIVDKTIDSFIQYFVKNKRHIGHDLLNKVFTEDTVNRSINEYNKTENIKDIKRSVNKKLGNKYITPNVSENLEYLDTSEIIKYKQIIETNIDDAKILINILDSLSPTEMSLMKDEDYFDNINDILDKNGFPLIDSQEGIVDYLRRPELQNELYLQVIQLIQEYNIIYSAA